MWQKSEKILPNQMEPTIHTRGQHAFTESSKRPQLFDLSATHNKPKKQVKLLIYATINAHAFFLHTS